MATFFPAERIPQAGMPTARHGSILSRAGEEFRLRGRTCPTPLGPDELERGMKPGSPASNPFHFLFGEGVAVMARPVDEAMAVGALA